MAQPIDKHLIETKLKRVKALTIFASPVAALSKEPRVKLGIQKYKQTVAEFESFLRQHGLYVLQVCDCVETEFVNFLVHTLGAVQQGRSCLAQYIIVGSSLAACTRETMQSIAPDAPADVQAGLLDIMQHEWGVGVADAINPQLSSAGKLLIANCLEWFMHDANSEYVNNFGDFTQDCLGLEKYGLAYYFILCYMDTFGMIEHGSAIRWASVDPTFFVRPV